MYGLKNSVSQEGAEIGRRAEDRLAAIAEASAEYEIAKATDLS